jgi:tagatose 6-phosphate kinase
LTATVGPAATLDPEGPSPERLRELGAAAVWLSLGADGSLLSTRDGTWRLTPPPSRAIVNAVGCGDALVGGLAAGLVRGLDLLEAARLGTAAATDKLAWLHPAHVTRRSVEALREQVRVERIV